MRLNNTLFSRILTLLIACHFSCTKNEKLNTKGDYEKQLDYSKFINPVNEFRSHPFYSLNDDLDTSEIRIQIEGFKNAGFGGFYLHSRDGLLTGFLEKEWWDNMNTAVNTGRKTGLHTMFYDEDKWPSGYAGGIMPGLDSTFRAKCLARISKDTPLPNGGKILTSDSLFLYIEYTAKQGNPKFNGASYVDLMNPEMVKTFIDIAYKPYIDKFKNTADYYTPAIFSDEPHIHARYFDPGTPNLGLYSYSPSVSKKFRELFGYDFLEKVSLLFEEKENWREVRLQYHQAVALQFEESFTKQIAAYCEENGFKYTGHFLGEDVLQKVRDRAGNTMLHYRNMQQPGMDLLGLGFKGKIITARALSSVANQYGIPRRLSELFGISGQNMNFEDRKWLAGWHTINGINHLCPHLTLYSMKGLRKRDYPPTFSYHQPYFKYNKEIEDYLGRISYAATIGEYSPQILVVNPLESEYIKGNNDGEFTKSTLDVLEKLQSLHYDYDLGDEQIIYDIAKNENGLLKIGSMTYEAVLLPDMIELRSSTANLLTDFYKHGGKIIYTGRLPEFFDGTTDTSLYKKLENCCVPISFTNLDKQLPKVIHPVIKIENDNGEVWAHVRKTGDGVLIQLYNTSRTGKKQFTITSELIDESTILWDPSKAACFPLNQHSENGLNLEIEPSSVLWLTSGSLSSDAQNTQVYRLKRVHEKVIALNETWIGKRLSPNAITLDFATYSTNNGKTFSREEPVIGIFNRLKEIKYSGELMLRFNVDIQELPPNAAISVEQPEIYSSITFNRNPLTFANDVYFIDHSFPTCDVSGFMEYGANIIELKTDFNHPVPDSPDAAKRYGTEIESIYFLGDFGVTPDEINTTYDSDRNRSGNFRERPVYGLSSFTITTERKGFTGDLTMEGYPFYAGDFELMQSFNLNEIKQNTSYFIEFPNCEAINILVEINGHSAGLLSWSPFCLDITQFLEKGQNDIKVTLTNSLRNLLGPHHQQRAELTRVGPCSFGGSGGFPDPAGEADWYDLRLKKEPLRLWTDTYYCIPFGFIEPPIITTTTN